MSERIQLNFYRVKVLDIFLLLSVMSTEVDSPRASFKKQQVDVVKEIGQYITTHYAQKITLEDISAQFDKPMTTLKRCFKGVYGITIHQART